MSLLAVESVRKRIGGIVALNDVSFAVDEGEIFGVIGPNGAGKTTLFNVITAFMRPDAGAVRFAGHRIDRLRPDQICRLGIVRTFQHAQPFLDLSVLENVMIGGFARHPDRRTARARALAALRMLDLEHRAADPGRGLPPADLKKLELARALAADPRLLLLDECMAGLRSREIDALITCIQRLNAGGVTVIVIDHVISAIRALAGRVVMLHHGEKCAEGPVETIFSDRNVIDAYLGAEEVDA